MLIIETFTALMILSVYQPFSERDENKYTLSRKISIWKQSIYKSFSGGGRLTLK